jgi:hypothetical protein
MTHTHSSISNHSTAPKQGQAHTVSALLILGILCILPRIRLLIVEVLDKSVVGGREKSAQQRTKPVDPMITGKRASGDGGAK